MRPEQTEPENAPDGTPDPEGMPRVNPDDPTRGVTEHQLDEPTSAEEAAADHEHDEENIEPLPNDPREPREAPEPFSGPSR